MLKPYCEFEPKTFDAIQENLVPYIKSTYSDLTEFWNTINQTELFKNVPGLAEAIEEITGQLPNTTYLLIIAECSTSHMGDLSIHQDSSVETTRLNWPVLNSDSIKTKFFNSNVDPTRLILPTGEVYLSYQKEDCTEIDSLCLNKPTAFRVHTIHGLYLNKPQLPRYILSFKFDNDISYLLEQTDGWLIE